MKSSLFNTFFCSSLMLVFATGCGKEQKSGTPAPAPAPAPAVQQVIAPVINPTVGNLSAAAQAALAELKTWYAASETATAGLHGLIYKQNVAQSSSSASFSFQGSLCLGSFININCDSQAQAAPAANNCYVKSADQVNYDIGIPKAGAQSFGCEIQNVAVTKLLNTALTAAVNGNGLTLFNVQKDSVSDKGAVYTLVYGTYDMNGQAQVSAIYKIDSRIHSIFNPVMTQTSQTSIEAVSFRTMTL